MSGPVEITIVIDPVALPGCSDSFLATAWHVAQANPAQFGDQIAGDLVERVGREIICRWLATVSPELWHHQGHHHHWDRLRRLARYEPGGPTGTTGTWTPRTTAESAAGTEGDEQ